MDPKVLHKIGKSMPAQVHAVIKAKGGNSKRFFDQQLFANASQGPLVNSCDLFRKKSESSVSVSIECSDSTPLFGTQKKMVHYCQERNKCPFFLSISKTPGSIKTRL